MITWLLSLFASYHILYILDHLTIFLQLTHKTFMCCIPLCTFCIQDTQPNTEPQMCVVVTNCGFIGTNLQAHNRIFTLHTEMTDWKKEMITAITVCFSYVSLLWCVAACFIHTQILTKVVTNIFTNVQCNIQFLVECLQKAGNYMSLCGFPRWLGGSDNRQDGPMGVLELCRFVFTSDAGTFLLWLQLLHFRFKWNSQNPVWLWLAWKGLVRLMWFT